MKTQVIISVILIAIKRSGIGAGISEKESAKEELKYMFN